jgi:hypothetical protein
MNLMVDDDGNVSGLVDWEDESYSPFGVNLAHVYWILGNGLDEDFTRYENAEEIEARF